MYYDRLTNQRGYLILDQFRLKYSQELVFRILSEVSILEIDKECLIILRDRRRNFRIDVEVGEENSLFYLAYIYTLILYYI